MWRITNILLLIFLVFAIGIGGFTFYSDYLRYLDWDDDESAARDRTLNADEVVDEEGRKLRTQAVSFDSVIEYDSWGPWSVVPVQQSALSSPQVMPGDGDTTVLTSTITSQQLARKSNSAEFADRASSIYTRYTNNLVLRNENDGSERLLFTGKVAITNILPLPYEQSPGIVAAYIGADSNGDGKINGDDETKVRLFHFNGDAIDVPYAGRFISFRTFEEGDSVFRFTSYLDLNANAEIDSDREPKRAFEVNVETGTVHPLLSDETVATLQAVIDGPAGGE